MNRRTARGAILISEALMARTIVATVRAPGTARAQGQTGARAQGQGQQLRLVDHCCYDLDGEGLADDGIMIVVRLGKPEGKEVVTAILYEDPDENKRFSSRPGCPSGLWGVCGTPSDGDVLQVAHHGAGGVAPITDRILHSPFGCRSQTRWEIPLSVYGATPARAICTEYRPVSTARSPLARKSNGVKIRLRLEARSRSYRSRMAALPRETPSFVMNTASSVKSDAIAVASLRL